MKWLRSSTTEDRKSTRDAAPAAVPAAEASLVYAAAALCLRHPDEQLLSELPTIALAADTAGVPELFAPVLEHLSTGSLTELQAYHAQEFDLSRRHALHLTYWTDGDTRRRGESLLRFKQAYRDSGLLVDLNGELPDHLPMVLEFAVQEPDRGFALLQQSRPSLELLRLALRDDDLPHTGVLTAICATLPGKSPSDRLSVSRMSGVPEQPPAESVGLAPYGTRLPLITEELS